MLYGLVILSLLISLAAQIHVKSSFRKYSQVRNERGMTGAEAARQLLLDHGITNVGIQQVAGSLTDHYDPRTNIIRLSEDVYNSDSVAAVGVAMHEAGHALQYAEGYFPIRVRNAIVKSTNICSTGSYLLVLIGILVSGRYGNALGYNLITLGIVFFLAVLFFQLVTLPVEFNASGRAVRSLRETGILNAEEQAGVRKVLTAAALTYVAAVAVSLIHLLRLLAIRGRRR
ncbi:MAG: zinc metallopeptidase [Oscillospiraceae bacterium]|nr:zinc metallopeptidase [Oscillospiraceae bacterium]